MYSFRPLFLLNYSTYVKKIKVNAKKLLCISKKLVVNRNISFTNQNRTSARKEWVLSGHAKMSLQPCMWPI